MNTAAGVQKNKFDSYGIPWTEKLEPMGSYAIGDPSVDILVSRMAFASNSIVIVEKGDDEYMSRDSRYNKKRRIRKESEL